MIEFIFFMVLITGVTFLVVSIIGEITDEFNKNKDK